MDRDTITILREIGRGEFGTVMEAEALLPHITQPKSVAVKMLKVSNVITQQAFISEAERLQTLTHRNVVKIIGVCLRSEPLLIIMEHMEKRDMKTYLRGLVLKQEKLSEVHLAKFAVDVSRGFQYLQGMKFVHRDLAARNVLVDVYFVAKIGDFGMARHMHASDVSSIRKLIQGHISFICIYCIKLHAYDLSVLPAIQLGFVGVVGAADSVDGAGILL